MKKRDEEGIEDCLAVMKKGILILLLLGFLGGATLLYAAWVSPEWEPQEEDLRLKILAHRENRGF